ncbi:MAG: universal stress protein [Gammaproteobacteria bacterium]|nr:universal stress protein [Gammaproteobacteria bacterium]
MIKILAATGGSRHAERAVRLGCQLTHTRIATLTVLTVEDPKETIALEHIQNKAMEVTQQFGTAVTLVHSAGHPAKVIRSAALEGGYDLLVIGARGLHSMQDFFLGRNAIRLVKNLPVSTLITRKTDTVKKLLWRIPRGSINEKHFTLMVHLVNTLKASLTLLDIEPSAILFGHRQNTNLGMVNTCEVNERLSRLQSRISQATAREVICRTRTGIPEEVILNEAASDSYDLVAISVQPRRGLGKLFAEDLPYRVARNIPISVLLLN